MSLADPVTDAGAVGADEADGHRSRRPELQGQSSLTMAVGLLAGVLAGLLAGAALYAALLLAVLA